MSYQPFKNSNHNLQFQTLHLSEILTYGLGFSPRDCQYMPLQQINGGHFILEGTANPFMLDVNGQKQYYQRELCWSLADKQNLIDAIYNYCDIGKFVIVRRSYDYLEKMIQAGHLDGLAFHELVDGKQRLTAIADFMQGKFEDSNGQNYASLDIVEKRKFLGYTKCSVALMENADDQQIKQAFLSVNHTGMPMSIEHINFIKSINI